MYALIDTIIRQPHGYSKVNNEERIDDAIKQNHFNTTPKDI